MTLSYSINDHQWSQLIQDVAESFNEVTINRGFQYYKQGKVDELIMTSPQYVEADVHGNSVYHVEIDLDNIISSQCNCPVDGTCKHMIAVLLSIANEQGRPIKTLINAKSSVRSLVGSYSSSLHHAIPLPMKKTQREAAIREKVAQISTMSVDEWHELFELCASHISNNIRSFQYAEQTLQIIVELNPTLTPDIENIYTLNIHLFVLSKLIHKPIHPSDYYYSRSTADPTITELLESVDQCLASGADAADNPNNPRIQQTLTYLRNEMLREPSDKGYYLDVYNLFWHYWIVPYVDQPAYNEELLKLEQASLELGEAFSQYPWFMAKIRMNFYLVNDEAAWELLKDTMRIAVVPANMSIYYLYYLAHQQQWDRLLGWLTTLPSLYRGYRKEYMSKYMEFWELAVDQLPDAEKLMWDTLVKMLPYSRVIYEEKLLQQGNWKQWMDYHLSTGSDPSEFRVSELQPLDKNAPEVLLPFYHQAVERYVLLKNRDGYKAAVKLLKRLAKLYKRLKQEQRWELFLDTFSGRYSRLRALQEELRKGKLIQ